MASSTRDGLGAQILEQCKALDALRFGEFKLASGQISHYYFDGRLLTLSPEGANLVAQALLPAIRDSGALAVGGPAVGAVSMVTEIVMLSGQDGGCTRRSRRRRRPGTRWCSLAAFSIVTRVAATACAAMGTISSASSKATPTAMSPSSRPRQGYVLPRCDGWR